MKNSTKLLTILFIISSLSITYGQEIQNNQVHKSKSNVKNNFTDIERKSLDRTVEMGIFHIDINNNGNEIIVIPTLPKSTVLELNEEGISFRGANTQNGSLTSDEKTSSPRDIGSGQSSGKRMHRPFVITKEMDRTNAEKGITQSGLSNKGINQAGLGDRKADENGDINISMLDSGDYKACYGKACFTFSYDAVKTNIKITTSGE